MFLQLRHQGAQQADGHAAELTCMLENSAEWGLSCDHSPRRPSMAMLDGVTVLTRTSGTLEAVGHVFRSCTLRWDRHSPLSLVPVRRAAVG